MLPSAALISLILAAGHLEAGQAPPGQVAGLVLSTEVVALPPFAPAYTGPEAHYERARADTTFEMLKITYRSDGLPVVAFVYKPAVSDGRRRPVIVYNRGSYVRQNAAPDFLVTFHRLAAAGFVIVAPMYRGSEGAPGRDEMGGDDLHDLMVIPSVVTLLQYADSSQLFLYGESRGGMMSLQALRDGFPARAAATFGAFTDLEVYLDADLRAASAAAQIWPDFEANRAAILDRRSAVRWAGRMSAPLLIMHGQDDETVSADHALALASALHREQKPFELLIVAGAKHTLAPFEARRDARAVDWFRRHLAAGRTERR